MYIFIKFVYFIFFRYILIIIIISIYWLKFSEFPRICDTLNWSNLEWRKWLRERRRASFCSPGPAVRAPTESRGRFWSDGAARRCRWFTVKDKDSEDGFRSPDEVKPPTWCARGLKNSRATRKWLSPTKTHNRFTHNGVFATDRWVGSSAKSCWSWD